MTPKRRNFSRREENADALADLAVDNFIEMRDKTLSLPQLSSFILHPYPLAARHARHQDRIVYASLIAVIMSILVLSILLFR